MGALRPGVQIVHLDDVDAIPLANGSWSRMVLNNQSLDDNHSSLGYSIFRPGTVLTSVSHEVEELAYVVSGQGELRLEKESISFGPNDALYIAPHTWHAVVNTGQTDLIMVFTFPTPDYPATERR